MCWAGLRSDPLRTLDAVGWETPARMATSVNVTARRGAGSPGGSNAVMCLSFQSWTTNRSYVRHTPCGNAHADDARQAPQRNGNARSRLSLGYAGESWWISSTPISGLL